MNPRYAPMFAPYTLNNGVAIKNRFVVAPLTIYKSDANGYAPLRARRKKMCVP